MKLIIRGHIRNAFNTDQLCNLVGRLCVLFPTLTLFIHTWNVFANDLSHRHVHRNDTIVSEQTIRAYFGPFADRIRCVMIEDDQTIVLHGRLHGNVAASRMPLRGWKNYWYGKFRIIERMQHFECDADCDDEEMIINTRFDVMTGYFTLTETQIVAFITANSHLTFRKNVFIYEDDVMGLDNLYVGNRRTMYRLAQAFHYELDDIISKNPVTYSQEFLVHVINRRLWADRQVDFFEATDAAAAKAQALERGLGNADADAGRMWSDYWITALNCQNLPQRAQSEQFLTFF
jgi:hypothetical protein